MDFTKGHEDAIVKLVKLGKKKGYVTVSDVKDIIPEHILSIVFDSVQATLHGENIDIISE